MKGQKLNGLFCDIEGTLFSNGVLNAHVLATIKQNEAEGKEITLWTDGNLTELQALLDANKITYPLRAKRDFAGAVVEMAIDDMDEHSFSALTKVYAERFIRAQDL
jgi:hydroxymethylpyrimidine pyrophosphatase-like HAD family hydrolase